MLVLTHGPSKEKRMSYAQSLLAKDEQIILSGRQHVLAPLGDSLRPFVLVLAAIVLFFVQVAVVHPSGTISTIWTAIWAILLLVGVVWMGIVILTWRAQEYLITNRRVLKVEGLLDKRSADSSLEKINDALLTQGILGRILHFGNLDILTAADEAIDRYEMLANAVVFKKTMLNAKNDLEDGYRGKSAPTAAAAAAPKKGSDDVTETLGKLADLRDKGAITPAEYEAKKAELLGRL
jgi:uncharacterized membrane protein YdbT with pleckstrin-like domain